MENCIGEARSYGHCLVGGRKDVNLTIQGCNERYLDGTLQRLNDEGRARGERTTRGGSSIEGMKCMRVIRFRQTRHVKR